MATDLTTIFGNEINVYAQPADIDRQYVGFPGCDGLVSMELGLRGRQLVISGTLASSGEDYEAARSNLQDWIKTIEAYLYETETDYSFAGWTYYDVVFDKFEIFPGTDGRAFAWTAEGWVTCRFRMLGRILS